MDCLHNRWGDQTKLSGGYFFIAADTRTNVIHCA